MLLELGTVYVCWKWTVWCNKRHYRVGIGLCCEVLVSSCMC